jgi:threonine dehydrogenase-like Zn-dependent dehydrogenase
MERAIPLLADGRLNLKALTTRKFSLDDTNKAFDSFINRKGGTIKVIIKSGDTT